MLIILNPNYFFCLDCHCKIVSYLCEHSLMRRMITISELNFLCGADLPGSGSFNSWQDPYGL